jgi:ribonuclease PH
MVFLERLAFVKSIAKPASRTGFPETDPQSAAGVMVVVIVAVPVVRGVNVRGNALVPLHRNTRARQSAIPGHTQLQAWIKCSSHKLRPTSNFASMQRSDGRGPDEIRSLNFELNVAPHSSGSVLISIGNTRVICAVTMEEAVPRWMKEQGVTGGWLTAEYSMLPYSTQPRKPRDITKGRIDGRCVEIQRLIGRSLRAVVDLEKLGPRTIWVDCDVLQADGGTRTAAITGASLALAIACRKFVREKKLAAPPMQKLVAAVSAGILNKEAIVDLNYEEDKLVTVDFNLVATEDGEFVEVQSSGEEATFAGSQLDEMLALGRKGIGALIGAQRAALARIMVTPES